jgi:hypothetical protein
MVQMKPFCSIFVNVHIPILSVFILRLLKAWPVLVLKNQSTAPIIIHNIVEMARKFPSQIHNYFWRNILLEKLFVPQNHSMVHFRYIIDLVFLNNDQLMKPKRLSLCTRLLGIHDPCFSPVIFDLDSAPATNSSEYKLISYQRPVPPFALWCKFVESRRLFFNCLPSTRSPIGDSRSLLCELIERDRPPGLRVRHHLSHKGIQDEQIRWFAQAQEFSNTYGSYLTNQ